MDHFFKYLLTCLLLFYLFIYSRYLFFHKSLISTQKLFDVHRYFAYIDVCVPGVCSASGGQKQASDPLELEIEIVVSYHVGAGDLWEPTEVS